MNINSAIDSVQKCWNSRKDTKLLEESDANSTQKGACKRCNQI